MISNTRLLGYIENAAGSIRSIWPLRTFIAANPLAGFENMDFPEAVKRGGSYFGGTGFPSRKTGFKAYQEGKIDPDILKSVLKKNDKAHLFTKMTSGECIETENKDNLAASASLLNAILISYLCAFLDEGQAAWPMPYREQGFYRAWKKLAIHDSNLKDRAFIKSLPEKSLDALGQMLENLPENSIAGYLEKHLAALPGWSGFIKWRASQKHYFWQKACPISLADYLAVRLSMAKMLKDEGLYENRSMDTDDYEGFLWLEAWEETYRQSLLKTLHANGKITENNTSEKNTRPDAQVMFCIDVRSEVFRRHLERTGRYETFGFAGFFGIPVRHTGFGEDIPAESCPVLLDPQYNTTDIPCCGHEHKAEKYLRIKSFMKRVYKTYLRLKNDLAASFATVEATGAFFSAGLLARTFRPFDFKSLMRNVFSSVSPAPVLEPVIRKSENNPHGLSFSERVFHAEATLKMTGLTHNFAPLIVFCGHGSETVNNPYASGLDCGACGGNHGGPNARIMAAILNDPDVREALEARNIQIPGDTLFLGAQHNTTTDEVKIFGPVPFHEDKVSALKKDLDNAGIQSRQERRKCFSTPHYPLRRAADWAEVRPEWGLARNAAFIIGPRSLTRDLNLEGRTFLHSYVWEEDTDGKTLETIMTAPLVVAQWINTQYYFSTVDNAVYGSGSKTTHNVTGKFGVMQGNMSDLMTGLPQQSVMKAAGEFYHEPLRLAAIVEAPLSRVTEIIAANDILQRLFDNAWVALYVMDPHSGCIKRYTKGKVWTDAINPQTGQNTPEARIEFPEISNIKNYTSSKMQERTQ